MAAKDGAIIQAVSFTSFADILSRPAAFDSLTEDNSLRTSFDLTSSKENLLLHGVK